MIGSGLVSASCAIASLLALLATPSPGLTGSQRPSGGSESAETPTSELGSGIEELILDNGMRFLFLERRGQPLVAAGWAVRSGSAAESPGKTGVAHLIEHLLFTGTEEIGTTDWERERELLELREELEDERRGSRPGADVERRIARVDERLRALRRKGEYALIYTESGALGINAITNQDLSYFTVSLPPARLELWFWMESDRLLRPVFREIYPELGVVEEERGQRILSVPGGPARARFDSRFWGPDDPYSWPAIGHPADVASLRRADVEGFFREHYTADRLTAVLVGDFDTEQVSRWARLYFGRLPAESPESPGVAASSTVVRADDQPNAAPEPFVLRELCECRPQVELRFRSVPFGHPDGPSTTLPIVEKSESAAVTP